MSLVSLEYFYARFSNEIIKLVVSNAARFNLRTEGRKNFIEGLRVRRRVTLRDGPQVFSQRYVASDGIPP